MSLIVFRCPTCGSTFTAHVSCGVYHYCPKNLDARGRPKYTEFEADNRVGKL